MDIFCAVKIYSCFILKDDDFYFSANWFGWFFVVWHCCVHFMSCRKTCHKNGGTSCQLILLGATLRESKRINLICLLRFCNLALGYAGNRSLTSLSQYFPTLRSKAKIDQVCLEIAFHVWVIQVQLHTWELVRIGLSTSQFPRPTCFSSEAENLFTYPPAPHLGTPLSPRLPSFRINLICLLRFCNLTLG